MNGVRQILAGFSRWMDCVAVTVVRMLGWFVSPRRVRLVEGDDKAFTFERNGGGLQSPIGPLTFSGGIGDCSDEAAALLKGCQAELSLRAERFFFRPLELPRRAAEFLDGIIKAQIDRITPWSASEAVYGWSEPVETGADRISLTVAAAARAQIVPYAEGLSRLGVKSVVICVRPPQPQSDEAPIKVLDQTAAGALEVRKVRRMLVGGLACLLLLTTAAVAAGTFIGNDLRAQQADLARRIAERRGIIRAGTDAATNSALARLAQRKNQTPASVIVLEALSHVLPDHTYVTELRLERDKVQVVGITNDAPSLIRLIEQSPHFNRATFFAPTTRSPSDPGDRFHIEAKVNAVFSPPS
jgi:general secretion pathway protein L